MEEFEDEGVVVPAIRDRRVKGIIARIGSSVSDGTTVFSFFLTRQEQSAPFTPTVGVFEARTYLNHALSLAREGDVVVVRVDALSKSDSTIPGIGVYQVTGFEPCSLKEQVVAAAQPPMPEYGMI